jgi:nitrous oxidase accessory protein NosD
MISGNTITGYYAPDKDCIYIGATATGGNQTAQITNNYLYNNYYSFVLSETKNVLVSQNTAEGIWTGGDVADSGTNTQFVLNFFDGKFYATGHP